MKQPLTQSVEDLHAAGYVVLGPETAEEVAALLGTIAFEDGPVDAAMRERAADALAAFPDGWCISGR